MVEKWKLIRNETKRKRALLKRKAEGQTAIQLARKPKKAKPGAAAKRNAAARPSAAKKKGTAVSPDSDTIQHAHTQNIAKRSGEADKGFRGYPLTATLQLAHAPTKPSAATTPSAAEKRRALVNIFTAITLRMSIEKYFSLVANLETLLITMEELRILHRAIAGVCRELSNEYSNFSNVNVLPSANSLPAQGGLVLSKISGVGTIFGLLVHILPGPNKQRAFEPSMLLS
jgi:hypothetical protein